MHKQKLSQVLKWVFPKNSGTPQKSSILIGFSITNHPFWGTTFVGNPQNNHVCCITQHLMGWPHKKKKKQQPTHQPPTELMPPFNRETWSSPRHWMLESASLRCCCTSTRNLQGTQASHPWFMLGWLFSRKKIPKKHLDKCSYYSKKTEKCISAFSGDIPFNKKNTHFFLDIPKWRVTRSGWNVSRCALLMVLKTDVHHVECEDS